MRIVISEERADAVRADLVVLYTFKRQEQPAPVAGTALGERIQKVLGEEGFTGEDGDTSLWHAPDDAPARRYLVVGLGKANSLTRDTVRKVTAVALRRLDSFAPARVAVAVPGGDGELDAAERVQAAVEGALLGGYRFDRYFTGERRERRAVRRPEELALLLGRGEDEHTERGLTLGEVTARATVLARDLVSEPAIEMTPTRVAEIAARIAEERGLEIRVLDREEMERMGMGALLGVSRGSVQPPKLVHLTYTGTDDNRAHVGIVGKGITFDSGGLSLKPSNAMEKMKTDKAGAMAVLAVMDALPQLALPVRVEGVLALTENMPSGSAIKPGDVLRSMAGITIEVNNTDAEGRLVLCDALEYTQRLGVERMFDLATLTGACVVALGPTCAGVMGNSEELVDATLEAAKRAGEKAWPLPLFNEYASQLESEIADMKNTGERWGGALTAGLFLKEFVRDDLPWVHLDIAGPAYVDKDLWLSRKGPTGAGVRTVLEYLASL